MDPRLNTLQKVLNGLMRRYMERVPDVRTILDALVAEKVISQPEEIENDHIAFRTMGVRNLGIASLEKVFLHYGYTKRDYYYFPEKKLNAYWYSPADPRDPRIFISELRVDDLSPATQSIIRSYTDEVDGDPVELIDLDNPTMVDDFLHNGLWRLPTYQDYQALAKESEYAAWTIYNRYYLNHFTISVHNLKSGFNTVAAFNDFLERRGIVLNNSSGKIKTSPDGGLLQSATIAQTIDAPFAEGDLHTIPGSYVEFAERRVLDQFRGLEPAKITREHRREGFEAANADKIFESTYKAQTSRTRQ